MPPVPRNKRRGKPGPPKAALRAAAASSQRASSAQTSAHPPDTDAPDTDASHASKLPKTRKRPAERELDRNQHEPDTEIVFDDPFGDDFEQENHSSDDDHPDSHHKPEDTIVDPMMVNDAAVFRPGKDRIAKGEKLVCDETAYDVFHKCTVEWPSLSFDFVCMNADASYTNIDALRQDTYPLSVNAVLGTQADRPNKNALVCVRFSNLHRTSRPKKSNRIKSVEGDDDESSSDEESEDENDNGSSAHERNPIIESADVKFDSTVNRVRVMPQKANIVAAWGASRKVRLIDVEPALNSINLDNRGRMGSTGSTPPSQIRPFHTVKEHSIEGFALDWSRTDEGHLLSGALNGGIYLTKPSSREGASWVTEPNRYRGHTGPVEDIQWSPQESRIFASCSSDKTIRMWDVRTHTKPVLTVENAHDADVNVIAWNPMERFLIASGGDDGTIKVWDVRSFMVGCNVDAKPAADFKQHEEAITCVQWHPTDSSMLCAGSEDGTVSIWDLAVERDAEEELREGVVLTGSDEFPPQLLFIHMGQKNVKEARWHPACPSLIMSTGEDGLNLFQPSNITLPS